MVSPAHAGMDEDALNRLGAAVQADIDAGRHFGAALLVARGGQIVYRRDLGTVAPNRPCAPGDRYLLMSMSKSYTAALVVRAIDHGRFTFDTKVADLMPGFGTGGKENATVLQLLTHTAGLPTALVAPPLTPSDIGDLTRKAAAAAALPAEYPPGTRCVYTSGLGYDVLGQILVNTDPHQRSFRQIAAEDLFAPLGMSETSFGLSVDHPRRVPVSFTEQNLAPTSPLFVKVFNELIDADAEYPSAAAFSTIEDVFCFTEALQGRNASSGHRLLSPAIFDYARLNHTGDLSMAVAEGELEKLGLPSYPANYTLLGGYVRGHGDYHNIAGFTASPGAITAMGGASTAWLIDFERDLTFIFLSAGLIEGLAHPRRVQRLCDLAIAAVNTA